MSEKLYIHDAYGSQIPLLDDYGNLSMQVIMLYTEDKLTGNDRKVVDDFVASDEMSRDALEGYALTANSSRTRHLVNELNIEIQQKSGAKAVSPLMPKEESKFDYRKLAAAIALLVVVGGATFLLSQVWNKEELADNSAPEEQVGRGSTLPTLKSEPISELTDSIMEEDPAQDKTLVEDVAEPKKINTKADTKPFEEPNQAVIQEKKAVVLDEANVESKTIAETDKEAEDSADDIGVLAKDALPEQNISNDLVSPDSEGMLAGNGMARSEKETLELASQKTNEEAQRKREMEMEKLASEQKAKMPSRGEAAAVTSVADVQDYEGDINQDQNAKYPGGDLKMYKFIERKKNYPQALQEQGISGNVTITFDVSTDGRVINAKVKNGVSGVLDEDALRVVRSMPKWEPAIENGSPIQSSRSVIIKYGD